MADYRIEVPVVSTFRRRTFRRRTPSNSTLCIHSATCSIDFCTCEKFIQINWLWNNRRETVALNAVLFISTATIEERIFGELSDTLNPFHKILFTCCSVSVEGVFSF